MNTQNWGHIYARCTTCNARAIQISSYSRYIKCEGPRVQKKRSWTWTWTWSSKTLFVLMKYFYIRFPVQYQRSVSPSQGGSATPRHLDNIHQVFRSAMHNNTSVSSPLIFLWIHSHGALSFRISVWKCSNVSMSLSESEIRHGENMSRGKGANMKGHCTLYGPHIHGGRQV
jgi:hypothetical protein